MRKIIRSENAISVFMDGKLFVVEKDSHPHYAEIASAIEADREFEHLLDITLHDKVKNAFAQFKQHVKKEQ